MVRVFPLPHLDWGEVNVCSSNLEAVCLERLEEILKKILGDSERDSEGF